MRGCVPFNVPPGNRNVAGDFHRPYETQKFLHSAIHRTTLPQSALAGCQLPQRGSRGWVRTIQRTARKPQRCGRFSSPLRNSKVFTFCHSSGDTPSGREPGTMGLHHSTGYSLNRKGTGDFHRPYGTQSVLRFTIQLPMVFDAEAIPGGAGHLPYRNQLKA